MKKFIKSFTAFVDPTEYESDELLDNTIKAFHKVSEENEWIVDVQVSAVMKPVSSEEYTLCYLITALYYQEA